MGQPFGPAPGIRCADVQPGARRRRCIPFPGAASTTAAEAMPCPFMPTRYAAGMALQTSARYASRALLTCPGTIELPVCLAAMPAEHQHGGGQCQALTTRHCRGAGWRESAPEPPVMDVRRLDMDQADTHTDRRISRDGRGLDVVAKRDRTAGSPSSLSITRSGCRRSRCRFQRTDWLVLLSGFG